MIKKKKFDAVQMTRKIRDKLGKQYYKNTDQLYHDLETIKKKYQVKEISKTYRKKV